MKRLTYIGFRRIVSEQDFSEHEIIHLYKAVRRLDKEILNYFIDWANGAPFPDITIENFDFPYLINEYGLNPINAFIVMSWLKEDPRAAKYALYHKPRGEKVSEEEKDHLRAILKSKGVEMSEVSEDDTDDIEV